MSEDYLLITANLYAVIRQGALPIRKKPMVGPTWGAGDFSAASVDLSGCKGLHKSAFLVVHTRTNYPIATGDTLVAAMCLARAVLNSCVWAELRARIVLLSSEMDACERALAESARDSASLAIRVAAMKPVKKVSRRRKQVFARAEGKCHYCGESLVLKGQWHIDHKMPRALGGDDESTNLVASCVRCNLKKSDRTDIEFERLLKADKAALRAGT